MHIKNNLINFLYDKDYFISLYEDFIHVFGYKDLVSLTSELIILDMEKFRLEIKGKDLFITQMQSSELLIKGLINKVGMEYD